MQKLTMEQAIVISAYTNILICPFGAMYREIERRLGHPVFMSQLGNQEFVENKIMPKFKDDFIAMAPDEDTKE